MDEFNDIQYLRLSLERALWGTRFDRLRGITYGLADHLVNLRYVFDGPISDHDWDEAGCIGAEVIADYVEPWDIREEWIRRDLPKGIEDLKLAAWADLKDAIVGAFG